MIIMIRFRIIIQCFSLFCANVMNEAKLTVFSSLHLSELHILQQSGNIRGRFFIFQIILLHIWGFHLSL